MQMHPFAPSKGQLIGPTVQKIVVGSCFKKNGSISISILVSLVSWHEIVLEGSMVGSTIYLSLTKDCMKSSKI